MISRAAKKEREAIQELRNATRMVYLASSKLRSDSAAVIMSGKLLGATLIIEDVSKQIDDRTTEF